MKTSQISKHILIKGVNYFDSALIQARAENQAGTKPLSDWTNDHQNNKEMYKHMPLLERILQMHSYHLSITRNNSFYFHVYTRNLIWMYRGIYTMGIY